MIGVSFFLNDFLEEIGNINWDVIIQLYTDYPSFSFDILYNTIKFLLDKHTPLKGTVKSKKREKMQPLDCERSPNRNK